MLGETSLSREPMEVDVDDLDLAVLDLPVDPVTANTVDPVTTSTTVPLETPIIAGSSSSEPAVPVEKEVDQDVSPPSPKGKAVLIRQDVDVQPLDVPVPVTATPVAKKKQFNHSLQSQCLSRNGSRQD
ncbi:hypothetical protein BCR33DRAFT_718885 [Rhizoclosmatium globosum]|uniref:Uncharacterized protein n=1 Tax=Rhizoclosmatium globosum TaxID=329046 RepID=A0A1Y2C4H7_9FUNG|nr:hypothetical protein BCR33DRAFT_718885 [Rhizoclosmatium globosum]|eukprot:ORY41225.1 hypothetical protein BCR33DRAFT_718885 [Rhizoclosmatium globosum]